MISPQRLFILPVLLLAIITSAPSRADAQTTSAEQAPAARMAARISVSTSEAPRLMLEAPDMRAVDRGLTRGQRFRRAAAVIAGIGGVLTVGGVIGVLSYQEPADCIICGPLGAYATMGVGGLVLGNALILYGIGRGIEARHRTSWRASVDRHGGSVGLDLRF